MDTTEKRKRNLIKINSLCVKPMQRNRSTDFPLGHLLNVLPDYNWFVRLSQRE